MRVLQTLGERTAEGIFSYRRSTAGVEISAKVSRAASLQSSSIVLTHTEWTAILGALAGQPNATFRLTRTSTADPPQQSLADTIKAAVPAPQNAFTWNDSWASYVAAILEHEGSVDLYGGVVGGGHAVSIVLKRDV